MVAHVDSWFYIDATHGAVCMQEHNTCKGICGGNLHIGDVGLLCHPSNAMNNKTYVFEVVNIGVVI